MGVEFRYPVGTLKSYMHPTFENVNIYWSGYQYTFPTDAVSTYIDEGVSTPDSPYIFNHDESTDATIGNLVFGLGGNAIGPVISGVMRIYGNTVSSFYDSNSDEHYFDSNAQLTYCSIWGNSGIAHPVASRTYDLQIPPPYPTDDPIWSMNENFTRNILLTDFRNDITQYDNLSGYVVFEKDGTNTLFFLGAIELELYYVSGIQTSGIPLFLKAPTPVTTCYGPIGISGEVDDGVLLPDYEWVNHNSQNSTQIANWVSAFNSGVHTPVDASYITLEDNSNFSFFSDGPNLYYERYLPSCLFNRPLESFNEVKFCFRAKNALDHDVVSPIVRNVILYDTDGTPINNWGAPEDYIYVSGDVNTYTDFCTSGASLTPDVFSPLNNYLTFAYDYLDTSTSSGVYFSELELCFISYDPMVSSYITLYTSGSPVVSSSNSGIPLYTYGSDVSSSSIPLYIYGYDTCSSGLSLYLQCAEAVNSGIPLYISGPLVDSSGIPLYMLGHETSSGNIPLWISGPVLHSSYMPLFLKTDPIPSSYSSIPLYTFSLSATNSGLADHISLYMSGENSLYSPMPLYLRAQESDSITSTMPLYIKVDGNADGSLNAQNDLTLYLANNYALQSGALPLYLKASTYYRDSGTMPLYIARDSEGVEARLSMFLKVSDIFNSSIPLYVQGAYSVESGIPLVIPSTYGVPSSTLTLFTHGY